MENCSAGVWQGWRSLSCSRKGKIERDGKWYCKQHDPVAIKARRDETDRKYREHWQKLRDAQKVDKANQHKLATYDELLEALEEIDRDVKAAADYCDDRGARNLFQLVQETARAAIKKAKNDC